MDLMNIATLIARYLHIVCATLLVGGTLFYEMVVPVAIADLRRESQLAIMGRARWFFRQIVWGSAFVLIISGCFSAYRNWNVYSAAEQTVERVGMNGEIEYSMPRVAAARPGWWMIAHASAGVMAVLISLSLTIGASPPDHPIRWMRFNLVILLIVIFLGSATQTVRLNMEQPVPPTFTPIAPTTQFSP